MSDDKHKHRLARNDESRNKATHYAEEWSGDEIAFLMSEWPRTQRGDSEEALIAELLGRTIEACRQRFYVERRGPGHYISRKETVTRTITTTETYIGLYDDPEDRWWDSSSNPNPEEK